MATIQNGPGFPCSIKGASKTLRELFKQNLGFVCVEWKWQAGDTSGVEISLSSRAKVIQSKKGGDNWGEDKGD